MTATDLKNWLKTVIDCPSWTVGKADNTKTKTICVYPNRIQSPMIIDLGLKKPIYEEPRYQVFLRWGNNGAESEEKAQELYNALYCVFADIKGERVFISPIYNNAIGIGTDEKGIFEYTIDIKLINKRS